MVLHGIGCPNGGLVALEKVTERGNRRARQCTDDENLKSEMHIKDIPQEVMDTVIRGLQHFVIPILTWSALDANADSPPDSQPIGGTGTLVQIDGVHYILTAAHVWHLVRKSKRILFDLKDQPSVFTIPCEGLIAKELSDTGSEEWGPDLALLEIAHAHVSTISAHKSFLNLSLQRTTLMERPPNIEKGLWAVTGLVDEFGTIVHNHEARTSTAHSVGRALFSIVERAHQRGGYDYLDISAKMGLNGVPESFGGVSGGGLWQVGLKMDKAGKISWDGKRNLRGVAFWQSPVSDRRRVIRCHGPKSVFETAWEKWRLG